MDFVEAYRSKELVGSIAERIRARCTREWVLMEFCGTHTVSIFRNGLREMLSDKIRLVSGPGCPVCVTSKRDVDRAVGLCDIPGSIVATYGDLIKVPGSRMSLGEKRTTGGDVRIVYSSYDAVEIAIANPDRTVFFIGIGFETTAPSTAAAILRARSLGIKNLKVLSLHKRTPPVIIHLLKEGSNVNGFICPGHVCSIIGAKPLEPVARQFGKPCVIAGFEPADIMQAILMLIEQLEGGRSGVEIQYLRGVKYFGNQNALKIMERVFETTSSEWRGIGAVESTGLKIKMEFSDFDAESYLDNSIETKGDPPGCSCGEVLAGRIIPYDCPLFGTECNPSSPIGPCMVSSEGSCATYYIYSGLGYGKTN
ncbi:MAG: hydrogenase formation protein HypD [bacterium]